MSNKPRTTDSKANKTGQPRRAAKKAASSKVPVRKAAAKPEQKLAPNRRPRIVVNENHTVTVENLPTQRGARSALTQAQALLVDDLSKRLSGALADLAGAEQRIRNLENTHRRQTEELTTHNGQLTEHLRVRSSEKNSLIEEVAWHEAKDHLMKFLSREFSALMVVTSSAWDVADVSLRFALEKNAGSDNPTLVINSNPEAEEQIATQRITLVNGKLTPNNVALIKMIAQATSSDGRADLEALDHEELTSMLYPPTPAQSNKDRSVTNTLRLLKGSENNTHPANHSRHNKTIRQIQQERPASTPTTRSTPRSDAPFGGQPHTTACVDGNLAFNDPDLVMVSPEPQDPFQSVRLSDMKTDPLGISEKGRSKINTLFEIISEVPPTGNLLHDMLAIAYLLVELIPMGAKDADDLKLQSTKETAHKAPSEVLARMLITAAVAANSRIVAARDAQQHHGASTDQ